MQQLKVQNIYMAVHNNIVIVVGLQKQLANPTGLACVAGYYRVWLPSCPKWIVVTEEDHFQDSNPWSPGETENEKSKIYLRGI